MYCVLVNSGNQINQPATASDKSLFTPRHVAPVAALVLTEKAKMKTKIKSEQVHPAGAPGATFTPGPWHLNTLETVLYSVHATRGCVAEVSRGTMNEVGPDEIEANARLIALCPELLDAADHLLKEMRLAFDDVPAGVDAYMAILQGIVSKAKGQP